MFFGNKKEEENCTEMLLAIVGILYTCSLTLLYFCMQIQTFDITFIQPEIFYFGRNDVNLLLKRIRFLRRPK